MDTIDVMRTTGDARIYNRSLLGHDHTTASIIINITKACWGNRALRRPCKHKDSIMQTDRRELQECQSPINKLRLEKPVHEHGETMLTTCIMKLTCIYAES